jgi:hypothetical protein
MHQHGAIDAGLQIENSIHNPLEQFITNFRCCHTASPAHSSSSVLRTNRRRTIAVCPATASAPVLTAACLEVFQTAGHSMFYLLRVTPERVKTKLLQPTPTLRMLLHPCRCCAAQRVFGVQVQGRVVTQPLCQPCNNYNHYNLCYTTIIIYIYYVHARFCKYENTCCACVYIYIYTCIQ